jgi:hypothetical protein
LDEVGGGDIECRLTADAHISTCSLQERAH